MTAIEKILGTGRSARSDDTPMPSEEEFRRAEAELGFRFPESYREFVRLGGLGELRINHRVLAPSGILESMRYLPDREHVPFADNGCGDLYCWPRSMEAEPMVLLAEHDADYACRESARSFTLWLERERF
jgi:SMI1 / KNR4 family (SUKH-1)